MLRANAYWVDFPVPGLITEEYSHYSPWESHDQPQHFEIPEQTKIDKSMTFAISLDNPHATDDCRPGLIAERYPLVMTVTLLQFAIEHGP